jgi:tRNA 2-thiouridine synthesizing protein A
MPVLRTRKALGLLTSGSVLTVHCTDPLAGIDIPHLVQQTGDVIVASELRDGVQIFAIRKR